MKVSDPAHAAAASVDDGGPSVAGMAVGSSAQAGHRAPTNLHKAVALVLGLTAGLSLVLALFVGIAVHSGPNGVRLAVAGPPPAMEQIRAALAQAAGAEAFEISAVPDDVAARAALQDRTADGAIVIGPSGPTLLTASAGSPAISQLLNTAAQHLAGPAAAGPIVADVVPSPDGDSRGVGLAAGSLPMIIAGLALGAAAALALRHRWAVVGTVIGGAAAIAVSFAGVLTWLGVSGGRFWAEAAAIMLTVAACALVTAGMVRLVGPAGAGLGGVLLVILGNPLSGIATSPRLLPGPWGDLGQWLPVGAGGTLVRTVSYFPAASVAAPLLVLVGWALLGAAGVALGRARTGHRTPEPSVITA